MVCRGIALHRQGEDVPCGQRLCQRSAGAICRARTLADQQPDGLSRILDDRRRQPEPRISRCFNCTHESRGINNGQPSLWAYLFDHLDLLPGEQVLHLGCGTGYYTAIIAELVGSAGRVTAVEIDATLARKARAALADGPQVK